MSQVKRVFAGGNTPVGFYSFYHHIIDEQQNRLFILKGGPGTGKSTFMRKIGEAFSAQGFDIEQFHCSSDANSLDGVSIPARKVAIVDGTAPHIVDPKFPGSFDEIINLGDYWNGEGLERNKERILKITKENSMCFQRTYRFLRAARAVYDDTEAVNSLAVDFGKVNQIAANLAHEMFRRRFPTPRLGHTRHLFASAIAPQGPVNELPSIIDPISKVYVLKGELGTGKSMVLRRIVDTAQERGLRTEVFHCPMNPEKIEHVTIPEIDCAVVTSHTPHHYERHDATVVNMNECLNERGRVAHHRELHKNDYLQEELMGQAFFYLQKAKEIHDELEDFYIGNMDFAEISALRERVVERIFSYSK